MTKKKIEISLTLYFKTVINFFKCILEHFYDKTFFVTDIIFIDQYVWHMETKAEVISGADDLL